MWMVDCMVCSLAEVRAGSGEREGRVAVGDEQERIGVDDPPFRR